jgi:hypothetical protein
MKRYSGSITGNFLGLLDRLELNNDLIIEWDNRDDSIIQIIRDKDEHKGLSEW